MECKVLGVQDACTIHVRTERYFDENCELMYGIQKVQWANLQIMRSDYPDRFCKLDFRNW